MSVPAGYVDPTDAAQVRDVVRAVFAAEGVGGVFDLLGRLPGAQAHDGSAGGFLRRAEPPTVALGDEHVFTLTAPALEHGHVVRGVVLQRERLQGGTLADALGPVIARYISDTGLTLDAAAALTAARDLTGSA